MSEFYFLGNRGSMIVSRVFAVLIAAIAVEYIDQGIQISFCSLNLKSLPSILLLKLNNLF